MFNDNVRNAVNEVLREDEEARDSDTWLIIQVLRKLGFKIYIDYAQLESMPSFESITRCRRYIQNNEGLYPSSKEVKDIRKAEEQTFRQYRGIMANSQLDY